MERILRVAKVLLLVFCSMSCSTNIEEFKKKNIVEVTGEEIKVLTAQELVGVHKTESGKELQWNKCRAKSTESGWVLVVSGGKPLPSSGFCKEGIAQALLTNGYKVIGINRANQGASRMLVDYGGDSSLQAFMSTLKSEGLELSGVWSEGFGSILASRIAKKLSIKWVILGNGIYDLESYMDLQVSSEALGLKDLVSREGEDAFERRSIAWDYEGFPKQIYLYQSQSINPSQKGIAKEFVEGLAAAGHKVSLKTVKSNSTEMSASDHGALILDAFQFFSTDK